MKKMKSRFGVLVLISTLGATGCGNDPAPSSVDDGSSTNGLSSLVLAMKSKITSAAAISDYSSFAPISLSARSVPRHLLAAVSFASDWTNAGLGFINPKDDTTAISAKDYMGIQFESGAVRASNGSGVNAFSRMNNSFGVLCGIGVAAAVAGDAIDANGYLDNGSYNFTMTASTKALMTSGCALDMTNAPDDSVIALSVTSGSTNYDKVVTFTSPFQMVYMIKNDATVIRVAVAENGSNFSRTHSEYNKSTQVTRSEYISVPATTGAVTVYRLYYDASADEATILSFSGNHTGIDNSIRYSVTGKPNTGSQLALSMRNSTAFGDNDERTACVNASTGSIATDGSLCGAISPESSVADSDGALGTFYSTYTINNGAENNWGTTGLSDSDVPSFTSIGTVSTAAFAP